MSTSQRLSIQLSSPVFAFLFLSIMTSVAYRRSSELPAQSIDWQTTEIWSACSQTCGAGTQSRQFQCLKRDIYGLVSRIDAKRCQDMAKPTDSDEVKHTRPCNLGSCRGYRWRVSDWGHCSQTCGSFGTMTREVECVYTGRDGDIALEAHLANYYCGNYKRPLQHISCNKFDCKPEFVPEPWGKCIQNDPCRPGRQLRQLNCVSIQLNGSQLSLPKAACYLGGRPKIPTWRPCLGANTDNCSSHQPIIDTDTDTIVQMRKTRSYNFQVGQTAYVIPYTRLTVSCPVHYYSTQEIFWTHPHHSIIRYTGSGDERIRVDKRGKLRIRSFRSVDKGSWRCNAGNQSAAIEFNTRTPSAGFHDYIQRNWLWNRGMMSDDPKDVAAQRSVVQWVEGPWSACSKSCGDMGEQARMVRCERVDNQFYHILNDNVCLDKHLPKPVSQRKCLKSKHCPDWVVENRNPHICTDNCLDVNQGSIQGNLTCQISSRVVPGRLCEDSEKPDLSCPNSKCRIKWRISPWSQCSRSCGGIGVRARQLLCVWSHDGRPAGPLCYANQIAIPEVIEQCQAPPCKLDCVDFSKQCNQSLDMCKFTVYRYHCCASCRKYDYANLALQTG